MQFGDKNEFYAFTRDIKAALAAVEAKYGVTITTGNGRYSSDAMTLKLEVVNRTATGEAQDKYAVAFKQRAVLYGFTSEDLGRPFVGASGKIFKIAGLNTRGRDYPIIATGSDGKRYKFSIDQVKAGLTRAPK